jgi:ABC-type Fe3+-hydroxamate transport system substrate-binding protein
MADNYVQEQADKIFADYETKLDAMRQRTEAAEAALAEVPDYVAYYVAAWEPFEDSGGEGPEPLEFADWLQSRA